jgi:hypothetical protein
MANSSIDNENFDSDDGDDHEKDNEQNLELFEFRYGSRGVRGGRNAAERQAAWAAKMRADGFVQVAVWVPACRRDQLQKLAKSWCQDHNNLK